MASHRKIKTRAGSARWEARWREPGPGGKTVDRKRNFSTEKEAKAHARKMAEEREARGVGDIGKHTVATFLRRWLDHLESRADCAPTTLAGYRRHAEAAIHHIGHVPLEKLAPLDLDRLYATLLAKGGRPYANGKPPKPLSRQSVLHIHRVAHTAFKQAVKWKLIGENPAANATPPSVPDRHTRGYTKAETTRVLEAASGDAVGYCALALLLTTGIRRSELLGLALDSLDLEAGTIAIRRTVTEVRGMPPVVREITKNKSSRRTLSIPPAVVTLLRAQKARVLEDAMAWGAEYHRDPMYLFPGLAGAPMDPMALTVKLRQFRRRAGVEDVQPVHGWRHSAASLLIADGTDVKTTQSRLGHSTPVITLKLYADKVDERDRAAGESLAGYLGPVPKAASDGA
ncbi:site-specific integrase [Phenylobacterium sp. J426]|uniref:tyrosine-type recombinase/integrase n=1 Tax=Phenylobacterium sp. J426 TaxID=2898439 RepID=UPI0021516762|nr:site-specific integrase [Phenylobacterium sp. J426]MCR5875704.1 site-specific integrase [Phenylobacterium sp. J426]